VKTEENIEYRPEYDKIIGKISTQKCISGTTGLNEMKCLIPEL